MSFPIFLCLLLWGRVLHWTENLLLGEHLWSTCFHPIMLGLQVFVAMPNFSHGCWECELRSSCLWSKYSYPLRHLPSPFLRPEYGLFIHVHRLINPMEFLKDLQRDSTKAFLLIEIGLFFSYLRKFVLHKNQNALMSG